MVCKQYYNRVFPPQTIESQHPKKANTSKTKEQALVSNTDIAKTHTAKQDHYKNSYMLHWHTQV